MEEPKPKKTLSEISHLFLDSVREKQTGGMKRPQRIGPKDRPATTPEVKKDGGRDAARETGAELTEDELALVFNSTRSGGIAPITAVIGSHLNGRQFEQVIRYARWIAAGGKRVGLIEIDVSEFRLMRFDPIGGEESGPVAESGFFDSRVMSDALHELGADVDCWLLLAPNPRLPEARAILRRVDRWALLSTADHDGVVTCYRTLKGLADLHRPALSLALLDADQGAAEQVYRKLSYVCTQFLNWPLESAESVGPADSVGETLVLSCRPVKDKAALAAAVHWQVLGDFLDSAKSQGEVEEGPEAVAGGERKVVADIVVEKKGRDKQDYSEKYLGRGGYAGRSMDEGSMERGEINFDGPMEELKMPETKRVKPAPRGMAVEAADEFVRPSYSPPPTAPVAAAAAPVVASNPPAVVMPMVLDGAMDEVIELQPGSSAEASILAAVLSQTQGSLIECPIRAPACPEARLAVDRSRQVTLLAVARQGLVELGAIAKAYQWLTENRELVAMALPQFNLDVTAMPRLRLLVNECDMNAAALQPLVQNGTVVIQSYRRVKWANRVGLLVAAA